MIKNKKIINSHLRPHVKQYLLDGHNPMATADQFGINYKVVEKYYNSKAFSIREKDGVKYKRCINCRIYRIYEHYHNNGEGKIQSHCISCRNQINRNQYIMNKVKYGEEFTEKRNAKFRANYSKGFFNLKRGVKRRLKSILNNNFRILTKKYETK